MLDMKYLGKRQQNVDEKEMYSEIYAHRIKTLLMRQITLINSAKMQVKLSCSKITRKVIVQFSSHFHLFIFSYFQLTSHHVNMSNFYRFLLPINEKKKLRDKYITEINTDIT